MRTEIFVFDTPDGTPGMNNFPVPEGKKKNHQTAWFEGGS